MKLFLALSALALSAASFTIQGELTKDIPDPWECLKDSCLDELKACGHDRSCGRTIRGCSESCREKRDPKAMCFNKCIDESGNKVAKDTVHCGNGNKCWDLIEIPDINAIVRVDPEECVKEHCEK